MGKLSQLGAFCAVLALIAGLLFATSSCNEHRVSLATATGAVEVLDVSELGGGEMIDLLWVIDNSGSMCRSQEVLREGIEEFINILSQVNLDFHIGITTSHVVDCEENPGFFPCFLEPIAEPGHLQSTPQPLPGFDPLNLCYHPVDEQGLPIEDRFDPIESNIEVAVECTANPDSYDYLHTFAPGMVWESRAEWENDLRCTLGLDGASNCDPDGPDLEDFFPDPSDYRDIPNVLRSEDYDTIEEFAADFACASLVGTRGFGYEMGLKAAMLAVSPELTGEGGPNEGFIRRDAMTGLIFVSDENDCSQIGLNVFEQNNCGVANCTIAEAHVDYDEDDELGLLPTDVIYDRLLNNLAETKGVGEVNPATVLPASFHGRYRKLDPSEVPPMCPDQMSDPDDVEFWNQDGDADNPRWEVSPTCRSEMGRAWSGHRYEEFMRNFPTFFPQADPINYEDPLEGLVCTRDQFQRGLQELGDFFATEVALCADDVYACDGLLADCPAASYDRDVDGHCLPYPDYYDTVLSTVQGGSVDAGSVNNAIAAIDPLHDEDLNSANDLEDRHVADFLRHLDSGALATINGELADAAFYCDTGIELRLGLPEGQSDLSALEGTGYCLEGTLDTDPRLPGTCVLDPIRYFWASCSGQADALQVEWIDSEGWLHAIGGFDLYTRYSMLPDED